MNPIPLLKKPIVIVVIGILIVLLFAPLAMSASLFDDWNTTGEIWDKRAWHFGVQFDTINIIGSWKDGYNTETFTITGTIQRDNSIAFSDPEYYRYALYIDGSMEVKNRYPVDGSWLPCNVDREQSGIFYMAPWTTSVPTTGAVRLKVVMEVKIYDYFQTHIYSNPEDLAWDGAKVYSGAGCIELHSSTPSPIEVGGKVNLYIETGYTAGVGWDVMVQPPALRTDLDQSPNIIKHLGDNIFGGTIVYWTVPAGAFKESTDPLMNEWKAILVNQYFPQSWTSIFTIDQLDRMPIITDVKATTNTNSMTYTVTVEQTYAPLGGLIVNAWYSYGGTTKPGASDTQSWVLVNQKYPIVNGIATFDVAGTNIKGTIIVEMIAFDTGGRTSLIETEAFEWDGATPDPVPTPYEQGFVWTNLAIIIAISTILGIIAFAWVAKSLPLTTKLIIIICIGAIGSILVWMAGTLQIGA